MPREINVNEEMLLHRRRSAPSSSAQRTNDNSPALQCWGKEVKRLAQAREAGDRDYGAARGSERVNIQVTDFLNLLLRDTIRLLQRAIPYPGPVTLPFQQPRRHHPRLRRINLH